MQLGLRQPCSIFSLMSHRETFLGAGTRKGRHDVQALLDRFSLIFSYLVLPRLDIYKSSLTPLIPNVPLELFGAAHARLMHAFIYDVFAKSKGGRRRADVSLTQARFYVASELGESPAVRYGTSTPFEGTLSFL